MGFMDKMKKAAESAQAQTSKIGVGAEADQNGLANIGQNLMKEGVETPAHIDSMTSTGKTDTPGGTAIIVAACGGIPTSAPAWPTVVKPVRSGISPVIKLARPAVQLASA